MYKTAKDKIQKQLSNAYTLICSAQTSFINGERNCYSFIFMLYTTTCLTNNYLHAHDRHYKRDLSFKLNNNRLNQNFLTFSFQYEVNIALLLILDGNFVHHIRTPSHDRRLSYHLVSEYHDNYIVFTLSVLNKNWSPQQPIKVTQNITRNIAL